MYGTSLSRRQLFFFFFLCIGQLEHAKCTIFGAAICWLREEVDNGRDGLLRTFRKGVIIWMRVVVMMGFGKRLVGLLVGILV